MLHRKEVNELVSHLIKMPQTKMWVDYDKEADVLYVSFKRPQRATDSEMLENGIILRSDFKSEAIWIRLFQLRWSREKYI